GGATAAMVGREILPWSRGVGVPRKDKVQAKRGRSLSATARQRRRAVTDALMLASSEHATSGAPADERLGARGAWVKRGQQGGTEQRAGKSETTMPPMPSVAWLLRL